MPHQDLPDMSHRSKMPGRGRPIRPVQSQSPPLLLPLLLAIAAGTVSVVRGQQQPVSPVGVNYGAGFALHPLPKQEAFALLGNKGVRRIKLFDRDAATLQAIQQAIPDAEVTVGLGNDQLSALAADPAAAMDALRPLQAFGPMIRYVAVGSEPNEAPAWEGNATALAAVLIPALEHTAAALSKIEGLQGAKAVVPLTMAVVRGFERPRTRKRRKQDMNMPPPMVEEGRFLPAWDASLMRPLLAALNSTGAPVVMNIHPYALYKDRPRAVDVGFAMGNDSVPGGQYRSLLDQMYDTLVAALAEAGYGGMEVVVGETGWPTAGGVGASAGNACRFMQSTLGRTAQVGTPLRPGKGVEMYLFSAFDEDGKEAVWGGIEAHWGVLHEDGKPKYAVDWERGVGVSCD